MEKIVYLTSLISVIFFSGCGMDKLPSDSYFENDSYRIYSSAGIEIDMNADTSGIKTFYYGESTLYGNNSRYSGSYTNSMDSAIIYNSPYTKHSDKSFETEDREGFENFDVLISSKLSTSEKPGIQIDLKPADFYYYYYYPVNFSDTYRYISLSFTDTEPFINEAGVLTVINDTDIKFSKRDSSGITVSDYERKYRISKQSEVSIYNDTSFTGIINYGYVSEDGSILALTTRYDSNTVTDTSIKFLAAVKEDLFPKNASGEYDTEIILKNYYMIVLGADTIVPFDTGYYSEFGRLTLLENGNYSYRYLSSRNSTVNIEAGTYKINPDTTGFNLILTSDNKTFYGYLNYDSGKLLFTSLTQKNYHAIGIALRE